MELAVLNNMSDGSATTVMAIKPKVALDWFLPTGNDGFWNIREESIVNLNLTTVSKEQPISSSIESKDVSISNSILRLEGIVNNLSYYELDNSDYLKALKKVDLWFFTDTKFVCDVINKIVERGKLDTFLLSEIIKRISKIEDVLTKKLRKKLFFNFAMSSSIRVRQAAVQCLFSFVKKEDSQQLERLMKQEKDNGLKELYKYLLSWLNQ